MHGLFHMSPVPRSGDFACSTRLGLSGAVCLLFVAWFKTRIVGTPKYPALIDGLTACDGVESNDNQNDTSRDLDRAGDAIDHLRP